MKINEELDRHLVIMEYISIVTYHAGEAYKKHWDTCEYFDLYQYGILGLIEAVDSYNENKDAKLSTWAENLIKWRIIDGVRKDVVEKKKKTKEGKNKWKNVEYGHLTMVYKSQALYDMQVKQIEEIVDGRIILDGDTFGFEDYQKEMIRLYYLEGYTEQEIADMEGVVESAISGRLKTIKNRITKSC